MSNSAESYERKSAAAESHPFYTKHKTFKLFFGCAHVAFVEGKRIPHRKLDFSGGYNIITPEKYETFNFPPSQCTLGYAWSFDLGLKFPLQPFIRKVLDFLNIIVVELYPRVV